MKFPADLLGDVRYQLGVHRRVAVAVLAVAVFATVGYLAVASSVGSQPATLSATPPTAVTLHAPTADCTGQLAKLHADILSKPATPALRQELTTRLPVLTQACEGSTTMFPARLKVTSWQITGRPQAASTGSPSLPGIPGLPGPGVLPHR